jgi:microcystin degradation protein MlrC
MFLSFYVSVFLSLIYSHAELFELRGTTRPEYLTIDEAIDACLATADPGSQSGPAVIADVWDNAGGGSAGDSTYILRRLIERNVAGAALAGAYSTKKTYVLSLVVSCCTLCHS